MQGLRLPAHPHTGVQGAAREAQVLHGRDSGGVYREREGHGKGEGRISFPFKVLGYHKMKTVNCDPL